MQSINFNTGYKTYAINEDENNVIKINVSDLNLEARLKDFYKELQEMEERYKDLEDPTPEQVREIDAEVKEKLNLAFGTDVSTPVFGAVNCLSAPDGEKPIIQEFLEVLMPFVKRDIEEYKGRVESAQIRKSKTDKYIKMTEKSDAVESVDIASLSQEEKDRILSEIFK